jgi:ADP-heptose:LPS heptosyltransferase
MAWDINDPQGNEAAKIAPFIVPYTRGRILDLGCGPWRAFPHFIGIDSGKQYGRPINEVANITGDCEDLSLFADASMDGVFSSHLLEHIEDTRAALTEWWRVIKPGGHLVLYLPDADEYPNIGEEGANPDHKRDFRPQDITDHMEAVARLSGHGWDQVEDERRNGPGEYSFFQAYRKHELAAGTGSVARCFHRPWRRQPNSCLVIRYGAIGDHIMASSVLPKLKEKGLHVTYNCEQRGQDILREDPHIDAWIVQDTDQVPNQVLGEYWRRLAERYDHVYNLSESIEGALLPPPGRFNHGWDDNVRRKIMGTVNYLDRTHDLCDVSRGARPRFCPTARERVQAKKTRDKMTKSGRHPLIMWVLSGSSGHKTWPWIDSAIASLMLSSDARIVTVGNEYDRMLERGWENERRVHKRAGKMSIRETLALAQVADIVVGPETGVLNAVSMEPNVAKVIILSHSSHENLTRDWVNTEVMLPSEDVACYPCHRLHHTFEFCHRSESTGAAACATSIGPDLMVDAIMRCLGKRNEAAA